MKRYLPPLLSRWNNNTAPSPQGDTFSLGHPLLFHWAALCAAVVLLFVSAIQRFLPLLALTVFFLAMVAVSWLWSRYSLQKVACRLSLNQCRAFPGESVEIIIEVVNKKWTPLPWLEIEAEVPYKVINGVRHQSPFTKTRPRWAASLFGGQRVIWRYPLECKARGDYRLGPVRLRSGDMFGCFPRETLLSTFEPLLVYPRIVPLDKLTAPWRQLQGDRGSPRSFYEDISRSFGARDYRADDPFNRIHWKASARSAQLQAKQYESTTSLSLLFLLDVASFLEHEDEGESAFELAVSAAASMAYKAHLEKVSYGLVATTIPEVHIPVAAGQGHLILLLEALARMDLGKGPLLHDHLDLNEGGFPFGVTPVLITHSISASQACILQRFQQSGLPFFTLPVAGHGRELNLKSFPSQSVYSLSDLFRDGEDAAP